MDEQDEMEKEEARIHLENSFAAIVQDTSPNSNAVQILSLLSLVQEMKCLGYECNYLYEKVFTLLKWIYLRNYTEEPVLKFVVTRLLRIMASLDYIGQHETIWDTKDFHAEVTQSMHLFYLNICTEAKIQLRGGYRIGDFLASCYAHPRFIMMDSSDVDLLQCELPTLKTILSFGLTSRATSRNRLCCHPLHEQLGVDVLVRLLECYYHSAGLCRTGCPCNYLYDDSIHPEVFKTTAKEVYKDCVRLLLRALPPYSMRQLFISCEERDRSLNKVANAFDALAVSLPQMNDRVTGCGVSSLQHLCRCEIRERLFGKWLLPSGIQQLPLPAWVVDYVDLKYD